VLVPLPPILEVVFGSSLDIVSSKGKKKKLKNQNKQTNRENKQKNKKQNKNPKFKWNLNPSSSAIVSSKEEKKRKKKKESGDSFVNVYLRLWLTCPLLSACCCWRLYLCRSQR
jgi:hypothetical protein